MALVSGKGLLVSSNTLVWLALGGAALALLIALPWEENYEFTRDPTPLEHCGPQQTPAYIRTVEYFNSHGTRCEAWVYLPTPATLAANGLDPETRPPVLVMAHGIGVQKDIGLDEYAERFAEAGFAVFVFDYRSFGGSDGEPRHWVSPKRYKEDWWAAVQHVKAANLGGRVDGSKLALWGVSYAGGHSLVTAARLGTNVAAVVANEPYLTSNVALGNAIKERGALRVLRLFIASISDKLRSLLGLPPVYIRLSAPLSDKRSLALVPLQDSEVSKPGAVRARCGGWRNLVMARAIVEGLGYKPMEELHNIRCPVFLRAATQDHLCPPDVIKAAAEQLAGAPEVFIHERNMTHLGAHQIGKTPSEIAPVIAFLKKHLYPSHAQQQEQQQQELNGHEAPTGQTEVLADGVEENVM